MSRFVKCLCLPIFAVAVLAVADTPDANAAGVAVHVGGTGLTTYTYKPSLLSVPVRTVVPYPHYRVGRVGFFPRPVPMNYYVPSVVPRVGYYGHFPRYRVLPIW